MLAESLIADRPEDIGIDGRRLQALFARVREDIDEGRLPSAQIAVARRGRLAGMATFGSAVQGGEIKPVTNETLYCVYSTTKGAIAVALWILMEEGLLRLDERIVDILPGFGTLGKEAVTVEHLVTHTAGFPNAPLHPEVWDEREARHAAFAKWRLDWAPGSKFIYHATAAHWVLAEIIHARTGQDHRDFVRERVLDPAGLDGFFLGLPPEHDARVAEVVQTVEPVEPPGGWGGAAPDALLVFNQPSARRVGVPGGGAVTGAAELAMLYQPLVNGGVAADGSRLLRPASIEAALRVLTSDQHADPVMRVPVNRAVGVVVAGDDGRAVHRGFGRKTSVRAFGHGGAGGQIAWGDPETGLSVGYVTNGLGPWVETGRRVTAVSTMASECSVD